MYKSQEARDRVANEYDPAADKLIVLRQFRSGDATVEAGSEFSPTASFPVEAIRRLIRTRFLAVLEREAVEVTPPADEFPCPQCDRTFAKKVNLGAHLRTHKD